MTDPVPKKTSLFKKILRVAGQVLGALIIPLDLKFEKKPAKVKLGGKPKTETTFKIAFNNMKMAVFACTYYVLQPLSVFLFPRAEDVLKKEGLDPKIMQSMTPAKDLRIIPNNILGQAYYILRYPPLFSPRSFYMTMTSLYSKSTLAFYNPIQPLIAARLVSPDVHTILVKPGYQKEMEDADKRYAALVSSASDTLYRYEKAGSARLYTQAILLHEIRHSSPENQALTPLLREADADEWAMRKLAELYKDPAVFQNLLNRQVDGTSDEIHDTGLYIYLKSKGLPIPSEKSLLKANKEAAPLLKEFSRLSAATITGNTKKEKELRAKFNTAKAKLSPLARQRLELLEAMEKATIIANPKKPVIASHEKNVKPT